MYDTIYSIVQSVNDVVWGWAMIFLLLGTHIFMTIRTKGIQRKVFKGIRLSVTKDPDAEGKLASLGPSPQLWQLPLEREILSA